MLKDRSLWVNPNKLTHYLEENWGVEDPNLLSYAQGCAQIGQYSTEFEVQGMEGHHFLVKVHPSTAIVQIWEIIRLGEPYDHDYEEKYTLLANVERLFD